MVRLFVAFAAGVTSLLAICGFGQPIINQQPESQVKGIGSHTHFAVAADGAQPLQFQWHFNGQPILGARSSTLHLTAAPSRQGMYQVAVRDVAGQERVSTPASLQVKPRPRVLVQTRNLVVREHETAVFEVQLNDSGPYTYINWYNYNPVEGSHAIPEGAASNVHSTRLEIPNSLNAFNYNGYYWLVVSNEVGGTRSRRVKLTVVSPPQLYSGPEDRSVPRGSTVSFAVSVVPDNAGTKRYQWFKNGTPVPGGTARVLRLARVQATHQGNYHCVVTSLGGSVESNTAALTVF